MTAKDFETIACIIREMPEDQGKLAALHFATGLRRRFPKFDKERFFKRIFRPEVAASLIIVSE